MSEAGELAVELAGRTRRTLAGEELPCVGDWVAIERIGEERGLIRAVLPRRTRLVRHAAGITTEPQVLAANVDILFLVSGLDRDWNPRRIERSLTLAWQSGATPVLVLNKADLCPEPDDSFRAARAVGLGVPVLTTSAKLGRGIDELATFLGRGKTGAFVGPSGVGKSSLVNALLGEERLTTGDVRARDRRGRHVTTRRELVMLPHGRGCLIDTPGLRELQLWGDDEGLRRTFADVEALAGRCRFRDCTHGTEPNCAVQAAVAAGELDRERYESFRELRQEVMSLRIRSRERGARERARQGSLLMREVERHDLKRRS